MQRLDDRVDESRGEKLEIPIYLQATTLLVDI